MAPPPARRSVPRDRFPTLFSTLKTQVYHDPASRGATTHATIRTLAWNPTGHLIATGSSDRTLRVWNPEKASVRNSTELRGHTGAVERVVWNPVREAELASASADGTVRFWDVRAKRCRAEVKIDGEAFTLAWSPDGRTVVAGRKDDTLVTISLANTSKPTSTGIGVGVGVGTTTAPLPSNVTVAAPILSNVTTTTTAATAATAALPHLSTATATAAPAPTSTATTATTTTAGAVPAFSATVTRTHPQPIQTNQTLFSHSGRELIVTTGNGSLKILAFPDLSTTLLSLNAHTSSCLSLDLCARGRYLAVGGGDALVSLWDTTDWVCRHTWPEILGPVRTVGFSFDGSYISAGVDEGSSIDIVHVETGEDVYTIPTSYQTPCVAWHPHRYWIAYSGDPMGLKIIGAGGGSL